MKEVFVVHAHDRWDESASDELVGISENLSGADVLIRDYIKNIYCYHSTTFYVHKVILEVRWSDTIVKQYDMSDVIRIARELGVYGD